MALNDVLQPKEGKFFYKVIKMVWVGGFRDLDLTMEKVNNHAVNGWRVIHVTSDENGEIMSFVLELQKDEKNN